MEVPEPLETIYQYWPAAWYFQRPGAIRNMTQLEMWARRAHEFGAEEPKEDRVRRKIGWCELKRAPRRGVWVCGVCSRPTTNTTCNLL